MDENNKLIINFPTFKQECKLSMEQYESKLNDLDLYNTNKKQYDLFNKRIDVNLEQKIKKEIDLIEKMKTNVIIIMN